LAEAATVRVLKKEHLFAQAGAHFHSLSVVASGSIAVLQEISIEKFGDAVGDLEGRRQQQKQKKQRRGIDDDADFGAFGESRAMATQAAAAAMTTHQVSVLLHVVFFCLFSFSLSCFSSVHLARTGGSDNNTLGQACYFSCSTYPHFAF
jgi:hypothetical protein